MITPPAQMAVELRQYGEEEVADSVALLSPEDLERVWELAREHLLGDDMSASKATATAAVEVVEGVARPLRRWRRTGPSAGR